MAAVKSQDQADKRDNSDYFVTMADDKNAMNETLGAASDAAGLSALISRATRAGKGAAPVERWNTATASICCAVQPCVICTTASSAITVPRCMAWTISNCIPARPSRP